MNRYQITFNKWNKNDQFVRDEVEASSFSLNTESNTYEFYNRKNERVFSAPRSVVMFVKRL